METRSKKQPRDSVSVRVDPDILEIVQHVAAVERRPVSSVVRNVLSDWARAREVEPAQFQQGTR
jgi:predicted transcriptional regulator